MINIGIMNRDHLNGGKNYHENKNLELDQVFQKQKVR